jgi:hypothetical protein
MGMLYKLNWLPRYTREPYKLRRREYLEAKPIIRKLKRHSPTHKHACKMYIHGDMHALTYAARTTMHEKLEPLFELELKEAQCRNACTH